MSPEALGIIDTAVKIGLGALISGLTAFFVASKNNNHQISKEVLLRRLNTIEKAAEEVNEFFAKLTDFIANIDGVRKTDVGTTKLSDNACEFLRQSDGRLIYSRDSMNAGISKLLLLGISEPVEILIRVKNMETELRDIVIFEKKLPDQKSIYDYLVQVQKEKSNFYRSLANHNSA